MKWKNYGLWVSLASIIYMVFKDLGVQIDLMTWETYVTAILGVLATLGIISNPDKGKSFFDKLPDTPAEAITQVADQLQNHPPSQQQGNAPQNQYQPMQFPTYNQQNQGYPPQQTMGNPSQQPAPYQNMQQGYSNQMNQTQNEYQSYQKQPFETQPYQQNTQGYPDQATQNNANYTQNVEQTQAQPEVSLQSQQQTEQEQNQTQNYTPFDKSSIHGMPPPPNER